MQEINNNLISCIRAALCGETLECNAERCIAPAYRHGVVNLLYYALAQSEATSASVKEMLKQQTIGAVLRETAQEQKLQEIYRRFEASRIRCVALKGIVLKSLYPKPEMRYMSDIDIIIDPSKADVAHQHMLDIGCTVINYDSGETDAYHCEGLNFELKKCFDCESFSEESKLFLRNMLAAAKPMDGYEYVCALPNEEHYAYILCHIVKHMLCGGVGIRPIMDVWICKNRMELDEQRLSKLLQELRLTKLAQTVEHLASVWFDGAEATQLDDELGEYIVSGGAFGTEERRVADRMLRGRSGKNKFSYVWKRFFLPYSTMRCYYPVLKKWPVFLPFFWIWRAIYALLFRRGKLKEEVGAVAQIDKEKLQGRLDFYRRCGIHSNEM